jgi:predicted esterase
MRRLTRAILLLLLASVIGFQQSSAQSIMDPNDPVVTYDSTRPLPYPTWGQIGKWVRTVRMQWNTDAWKAYYYKGYAFRLKFPKTYVPGTNDGKKYPLLLFFHGFGEVAPPTDNEFHLLLGHQYFQSQVENGNFDGYVLSMQSQGYFGPNHYQALMDIVQYMIANNKVDPFAVTANGLSMGGQASWEILQAHTTSIAAALPMSWTMNSYADPSNVAQLKYSPIWVFQGGRDPNPSPATTQNVEDAFRNAGANFRLTFYPQADHGTWNQAWSDPDFFSYIKRAYQSNPWPLYSRTDFFQGETINVTIGLAPGFAAYEWRKDGVAIPGTGNTITATSPGSYTARVQRNGIWSEWSRIPVVIRQIPVPTLPYKVEAESYYTMRGVQTEWTADAGGGLNVGYIDSTDWMDYSIYLQSGGTFTVKARVTSPFNNAQMQFRKPDGTVLSTINIPKTGGWQNWQTVTANITLPAGYQTLRVYSSRDSGWNINWFELSNGGTSTNVPPTANAGPDQTVNLPTSTATLTGSGTDPDGNITTYLWTKISGPSGGSITSPSSASTTVTGLAEGSYTYRLTVTDNNNATATDDVLITVNPAPAAGTLRIEAEQYSAMSGIQTEGTSDIGGGQNVGYIDNGDWMDYIVTPPSGAGTYTVRARVASQMTGGQFQLRNTSGTVLATFSVPNTNGWQAWTTITATVSLPAGQQTLRILSVSAASWNINWLELVASSGPAPNTPPTANAGPDQTIMLPASTATLSGSGTDADGTITGYLWTKVSGPAGGTITSPSSASTTVTGLAQGTYVYSLRVTDNNGATATDEVTINVVANVPPSSALRIEAENYTAMNGIQRESTTDIGGGQNLGYIDNGDWMDYSVNLAQSGTYAMTFRVASQMTGGQLQVRNSSGTVLATVNLLNTGGWQTWALVQATLTLPQGQQTLRIQSSSSASWNINWMELTAGSLPSSFRIEAENYTTMNGVQRENTGDIGGGQNVGYIDQGDWMDYAVSTPAAGTYTLNVRVASQMTGGQFQVRTSGGTVLATINVPNTGSWQGWQTVTTTISLPQGSQTLRVISTSAASWNINWLEFLSGTFSGSVRQADVAEDLMVRTAPGGESLSFYPNPVTDRVQLQLQNSYSGTFTVQVINSGGAVMKTFSLNKNSGYSQHNLYLGDLPRGNYILRMVTRNGTESRKLMKQ